MPDQTHTTLNQFDELTDCNLFATDRALGEALEQAGGGWLTAALESFGARVGSAETHALAESANAHPPELKAMDRRGRRIDLVEFHPAWHGLMALYRREGFISLPFASGRKGRWAAATAGFYLHNQVEAGSMCPAAMTQAVIPILQREPRLWDLLGPRLMSTGYDPRDVPIEEKTSVWIGMAATEKQGGSDIRANTTTAVPLAAGGRDYLLNGHKWFFSAPMCDAHLVVARAEGGLSAFLVPRRRADGMLNGIHIQRLKDKLGNRSNASAEVEFHDAHGTLVGEEGRGIALFVEMATYTRLACVTGSAALIRQALVQALAYTRRRTAFGKPLADQPLMRAVLADLALESEAALWLAMRLATSFEDDGILSRAWRRIMTPAAKFWVCKRAVEMTGEAAETFGGNGYAEGIMARLYREAPVNSIWEGSGNVMCLDVLRALTREPELGEALAADFGRMAGDDIALRTGLSTLRGMLAAPSEAQGRRLAQLLVLTAQGCLLRERAPDLVAGAFLATRFDPAWGRVVGTGLLDDAAIGGLLERAFPA